MKKHRLSAGLESDVQNPSSARRFLRSHIGRVVPALLIAGLFAACSSSDKDKNTDGDTNGGSGGSEGPDASAGSSGKGSGGKSNTEKPDASSGGKTSSGGSVGAGGSAGSGGSEKPDGSTETPDGAAGGPGPDGGTEPGATGWTLIPLIDDVTDPKDKVFRAGNDLVTGIYYASADDGWVTTTGSNETFGNGGAIFKTKGKSVSSILFGGNRDGMCQLGSIDFYGLDKSPDGFTALAYACDVVASHDNGKTFTLKSNQMGDQLGIEHVLAMRPVTGGTLMWGDSGYLDRTESPPGPGADWTTIWAPEAAPPSPDPVPADQCQVKQTNWVPSQKTVVYIAPKGDLIAYVAATEDQEPIVCVSKDSGKSFFPHTFPNRPDDATDFAPNGVVFGSDKVGIAFWGNNIYPGSAYIYRTTNAGDAWAKVDVPKNILPKSIDLYSAFFSPDGSSAWIVGFNYDSSIPFVLHSKDAGLTWALSTGDLAAKTKEAGVPRIRTGFALDNTHIWVGGDYGLLLANDAAGD